MAEDNEATKNSTAKNSTAKNKGGGTGKLLLVAMLALGAAAGYTLKGNGGDASAAGPTTIAAPEPGLMVAIEPLSLNLADDHYLKVGMAIQLVDGVASAEGDDAAATWLAEHGPIVRDLVIAELGGAHVAEFANAEAREVVRADLLEKANERLDQSVFALYFTEFIMQ